MVEEWTPASLQWGGGINVILKDYAEGEEGITVATDENAQLHLRNFFKFSITFFYGEYFFVCLYRYYVPSSFQMLAQSALLLSWD